MTIIDKSVLGREGGSVSRQLVIIRAGRQTGGEVPKLQLATRAAEEKQAAQAAEGKKAAAEMELEENKLTLSLETKKVLLAH
ncbi:hypothetical protein NDU88_000601 [Pleurodeles waltl]|uniref:Uncharacterized protein n=1 Tax=Pleurodeles waltl TaxID=8319 RepID=A0AAV7R795_PLEWA|nr:hypothetical protein NDU88_000601 [Pleurodeles waltl]